MRPTSVYLSFGGSLTSKPISKYDLELKFRKTTQYVDDLTTPIKLDTQYAYQIFPFQIEYENDIPLFC